MGCTLLEKKLLNFIRFSLEEKRIKLDLNYPVKSFNFSMRCRLCHLWHVMKDIIYAIIVHRWVVYREIAYPCKRANDIKYNLKLSQFVPKTLIDRKTFGSKYEIYMFAFGAYSQGILYEICKFTAR